MMDVASLERMFPPAQFPAHVFVDGEHFLAVPAGDAPWRAFEDTLNEEPAAREVALIERKPRHGGWLRSKLTVRGRA